MCVRVRESCLAKFLGRLAGIEVTDCLRILQMRRAFAVMSRLVLCSTGVLLLCLPAFHRLTEDPSRITHVAGVRMHARAQTDQFEKRRRSRDISPGRAVGVLCGAAQRIITPPCADGQSSGSDRYFCGLIWFGK